MTTPKRDTRLLLVAICGLFLILTITYAGRLSRKVQLEAAITQMMLKNEQAKTQQLALAAELSYVASNAYVEKLAHDEFGMTKPQEELIALIPIAQKMEESSPVIESHVVESPWQQLLQRLRLQ